MEMCERGLHERAYICAGIMPVKSPRMARYMQTGVPGMIVSEEFCQRLEKAEDPKAEAVDISVEYINRCKEIKGVSGVHVMAVAWESIVPTVVEKAGLLPRPTF